MSVGPPDGWAWLRQQAEGGEVHTVRVSFADRLGQWRGKRVPVSHFLRSDGVIGFGSGLLVADVACDVYDSTPFASMENGYPDVYLRPVAEDLRPVAWAPGEVYCFARPTDDDGGPVPVAAAWVLDAVVARAAATGWTPQTAVVASCRLWTADGEIVRPNSEPARDWAVTVADALVASGVDVTDVTTDLQSVRFRIGPGEPSAVAQAAVVAKGAMKELATRSGFTATFITVLAGHGAAMEVELPGVELTPAAWDGVRRRLGQARPLLQPSVNAIKSPCPTLVPYPGGVRLSGVSPEADPYIALALALAALSAEDEETGPDADAFELGHAAAQLATSAWVRDWLGDDYVDNAVPLLIEEARQFARVVTDWERERYGSLA